MSSVKDFLKAAFRAAIIVPLTAGNSITRSNPRDTDGSLRLHGNHSVPDGHYLRHHRHLWRETSSRRGGALRHMESDYVYDPSGPGLRRSDISRGISAAS